MISPVAAALPGILRGAVASPSSERFDTPSPLPGPAAPMALPGRWSASAWLFVRRGEAQPLAAGGTLGGSQIGGRLAYRVNRNADRPLAASLRFHAPTAHASATEAAVGLAWKPLETVPVTLLAERRIALGDEGRSAFALTAYGGISKARLVGPVGLDAYAQAGLVGLRSRDAFVDGAARLTVPIGDEQRVSLGAGVWGAAQPGVWRIDAGPHVSARLPLAAVQARLSAEWRFRVAGDASPASGPALTLSADF